MSLTRHLDDPRSPVRQFLEWTTPLLSDAGGTSADAKVAKRLLGIDALPKLVTPNESGANPGTVGAAFDYWVRYHLQVPDWKKLVAFIGASVVAQAIRPDASQGLINFFTNLERLSHRLNPARSSPDDDSLLARYCVVLAMLESVYRTGQLLWELPKLSSTGYTSPEAEPLLHLARPAEVQALLTLGVTSAQTFASWRDGISDSGIYIANPTFSGSPSVGDADADLVIGDQVIEIKTVKELTPAAVRKSLLQLVGYTILDWDDSNGIRRVGVFFARHGYVSTWPLTALLRPPGDHQLAWLADDDQPDEATLLARLQSLRSGMERLVSGEKVDLATL